jgi:hypothetical protein
VFDRIEVNVVDVSFEIEIIPNDMFPKAGLPKRALMSRSA